MNRPKEHISVLHIKINKTVRNKLKMWRVRGSFLLKFGLL